METIEYINPTVDRSRWPAGPWDGEPDKKQWRDTATGLPCLAVRHPRMGHWCGYVGVAPDHPYYGQGYEAPDVRVHWGLTFADKCQTGENECGGICHKAPSGEDDVWWLGFDCAHSGDCSPMDMVWEAERASPFTVGRDATYRTLPFVERECARLAKQLAEHAAEGPDAREA